MPRRPSPQDHPEDTPYDHLQEAGEYGCLDHQPHPRGRFNDLPRTVSLECRRCIHGPQCAAEGVPVDDVLDEDDRDWDDNPDDERARRARGIYPMGEL